MRTTERTRIGTWPWKRIVKIGLAALGVATTSLAQSRLFYESELGELPVEGVTNKMPALARGSELVAMPADGSYRMERSSDVIRIEGETEFRYSLSLQPKAEDADGSARIHVEGTLKITPRREVTGMWLAIGWMLDGKLSEVKVMEIQQIVARSTTTAKVDLDIDASWRDGILWYSFFEGDKPVIVMEQGAKNSALAEMRASIMQDDTEAVTGALQRGFQWKDLEPMDPIILAMHGQLSWLQAWAASTRSWPKKAGPDLLLRAIACGRTEVVRWLLENGVDPAADNTPENDILAIATEFRQWDMVPLILSHHRGRWKNKNEDAASLVNVVLNQRYDLFKLLTAAGVEWPSGRRVRSGMTSAINRGDVEMLRTMLTAKGSLLSDKKSIFSPGNILEQAIEKGNMEIVQLLLAQPINWEEWAKQDSFPIRVAVMKNNPAMIDALVAAGADPHVRLDGNRMDLVVVALMSGSLEATDHLLKIGVKPTTLKNYAVDLWSRSVGRNREDVAARLVELGLRLNEPTTENQRLLNAAMGLGFTPVLAEVANQGWSGDSPMQDDWNVAGLMEFYGWDEPAILRQAKTIKTGPPIVPPPTPIQVMRTAPMVYPPELKNEKIIGEVKMEVIIDEAGRPRYIRSLKSNDAAFSRQAVMGLDRWLLNPMPEGVLGWRRVSIPLSFKPDETEGGFVRLDSLDRRPVALSPPTIVPPAEGEATGFAAINLGLSATGEVKSAFVVALTDERWRNAVTTAARQWKFTPGESKEQAVATEMQMLIKYPDWSPLSRRGIPIEATPKTTPQDFDATLVDWKFTRLKEESRSTGVVALYRVTVKPNGKLGAVECVAISQPRETDNLARGLKLSRFRAALRGDEKIEQELLVPIVLNSHPNVFPK